MKLINLTTKLSECAQALLDALPFFNVPTPSTSGSSGPGKHENQKTQAGNKGNGVLSVQSKDCDPCKMQFANCAAKGAKCVHDNASSTKPVDRRSAAKFAKETKDASEAECKKCPFDYCKNGGNPPKPPYSIVDDNSAKASSPKRRGCWFFITFIYAEPC